jgi:hypothetical protein
MTFTKYNFFSWIITLASVLKDETFKVVYAEDTTRAETGNLTLYTKGLMTGIKDNDPSYSIVDRVPGIYSQNLKDVPAGTYYFTASDYSEWWCINYTLNGNKLPNVSVFRLNTNETIVVPIGTKLFICEGEHTVNATAATAPMSYEVSFAPATIIATTNCYGFYLLD